MICAFFHMPNVSAPAAPPGNRKRYVVISVEQDVTWLERGQPTETEWHITLRLAAEQRSPLFRLTLVQPPDTPAPYNANTLVELDPRLVEDIPTPTP